MSILSTRRTFMSLSGRAALGLPFLPLGACRRRDPAPAKSTAGGRWQSLIAYLEKEIPSLLQRAPTTPAASMALVADAKLLWSRGFGVKDRTTRAPVDGDTAFEFASVSKTVFAYTVMKACEKGVLDLDTPLISYTSERWLAGDPRLDLITPRMMLSPTTGFQNWRSNTEPLKIQFTPGTRWQYSGEGYSYLQSVLTHLTGPSTGTKIGLDHRDERRSGLRRCHHAATAELSDARVPAGGCLDETKDAAWRTQC